MKSIRINRSIEYESLNICMKSWRDLKMYGKVYENVIKFAPDSIWPWNDDQFLTYDEVSAIINKLIKGRIYSKVDTLDQLLRLFQAVTKH